MGSTADEPPRTSAVLLLSIGTALGGFGGFWPSPWNYFAVTSGALMSGAGALALEGQTRVNRRRWPLHVFSRRSSLRLVAAVAGAVALAITLPLLASPTVKQIRLWRYGCESALVIRALTSPDGYHPALELAESYERWTAESNQGCPTVHVHVNARSDQEALAALSVGWPDDHLEWTGPQPDVWLPASSVLVRRLRDAADAAGRTLPLHVGEPLAFSPIVLASSGSPADAAGYRTGKSWPELRTWLDLNNTALVRAEPKGSMTGELATAVLYTGISDPRAVERHIARSLDEGDYPLGSTAELLCRHHERGSPKEVALLMAEQDLYRFNEGRPLGGPCDGARAAAPTLSKLVALYPRDAPALDHPFVSIQWRNRSAAQRAAVVAFERWLRDEPGEQALAETGLRPAGRDAISPLAGADGIVQSAAYHRQAVESTVLAEVVQRYEQARRGARVLLLLDASGSMSADEGGATRLAIAAGGVQSSLTLMGGTDQFGVWVFPDGRGRSGVQEILPIGSREAMVNGLPRANALVAALAGIRPGGATPLYSAIVSGTQRLGAGSDEWISALIVLTDGDDDNASGASVLQLVDRVANTGVRVFAIAVGDARCTAPALARVTTATGGRCYDVTATTIERSIAELFTALWGGPSGGR